ncbi:MAG: hypothetical protein M5R36_18365 [Deltaproteobacteria bacterium]|nr:hypothetical protein [Deltaproteobacteria bacterium]
MLERDVTIRGTIVCGEEKQDVEIRFSAPARVVAGHWETTIEAPWLMRRIHPIGGVDARQSRELAVRFVLWMVEPDGKSIIIFNEDGEPVDFLEAVGIDGATTTTDA